MEQTTIVENYILAENYINTFLESSEEEYGIVNEAAILDKIIEKIKSIPKTVKLEIKKRTPEEIKKFKLSKQYQNLKAKLEKKAAKVISVAREFKKDDDAIDKHPLYRSVSWFLEIIAGFYFSFSAPAIPGFLGIIGVLAYQALEDTKIFNKFLDMCNNLVKSKTPSVWEWLNKVERTIFAPLEKNENEVSGKDESYVFILDC